MMGCNFRISTIIDLKKNQRTASILIFNKIYLNNFHETKTKQ